MNKFLLKNLVVFCTLILFPSSLFAVSSIEETVQAVQSTYEKAQDVSSEFIQKVELKALQRNIEKTGKALFKKPGRLYVEYGNNNEEGRIYISDGKKLWVYDKGDTQVNVYKVNPTTLPEEALAFLGGLGNLREQFRVSALSSTERKNLEVIDTLDWLLLIPKNPESELDALILGFDKKTHLVSEGFLKNESGNTSHYFFKNVTLNSQIPDTQFTFSKKPGVKEIQN